MKHNIDVPTDFIDNLIKLRMLSVGHVRHAAGVLLVELLDDYRDPENRETAQIRPRSSRRTTDPGRKLVNSSS